MSEAVAPAEVPDARPARRPFSLDLAIALATSGCATLATSGVWIEVDHQVSRGYQLAGGLAVAAIAGLGLVLIAGSRLSRDRRLLHWVAAAELAFSFAALAVTSFEIARPRHYEVYWVTRAGIWWTLGFAAGWAVLAVVRGIVAVLAPAPIHPPTPPRTRITPALVGALLATLFLIVGAFGPWSYGGAGTLNGLSGSYRGWVGLCGALASIVALLAYVSVGRRPILVASLVAAALSFGAAASDRNDIDNSSYLTAGWGVNVTLAASLALFVAACVMMIFREPSLLHVREGETDGLAVGAAPLAASRTSSREKVCPDCAETVKAAARVCRFCGYRFDAADLE